MRTSKLLDSAGIIVWSICCHCISLQTQILISKKKDDQRMVLPYYLLFSGLYVKMINTVVTGSLEDQQRMEDQKYVG